MDYQTLDELPDLTFDPTPSSTTTTTTTTTASTTKKSTGILSGYDASTALLINGIGGATNNAFSSIGALAGSYFDYKLQGRAQKYDHLLQTSSIKHQKDKIVSKPSGDKPKVKSSADKPKVKSSVDKPKVKPSSTLVDKKITKNAFGDLRASLSDRKTEKAKFQQTVKADIKKISKQGIPKVQVLKSSFMSRQGWKRNKNGRWYRPKKWKTNMGTYRVPIKSRKFG